MQKYIIKLSGIERYNTGLYRADFPGDPGRTFIKCAAKKYKTRAGAQSALTQIRNKYNRSFIGAEILKI